MPATTVPSLVTRPVALGVAVLTDSFVGNVAPFQYATPRAEQTGAACPAASSTLPAAVIRELSRTSSDVASSILDSA